MEHFWLPLASTILIQVVIALVTVRLALSRFREEKWWERKYEAYFEILSALHQMKKDFSDSLDRLERGNDRTPDQEAEFNVAYKAASANLMRHSDLEDFLGSRLNQIQ